LIKISFVYFFLAFSIRADSNYELKLYEKVLPLIFNSKHINIYVDSSTKKVFNKSLIFHTQESCTDADLIIIKKGILIIDTCKNMPMFALDYRSYKNNQNSVGVFYWRKGRPQLTLNKIAIEKFNLNLPISLKKYTQ